MANKKNRNKRNNRSKKNKPSTSAKERNQMPAVSDSGSEGPTFMAGYEAATSSKKRRTASPIMQSEDKECTATQRKQLNASARDQRRNIPVMAWALRKHVDFVSSFEFQSRCEDEGLNTEIENLLKWWSAAGKCDAAGRHRLSRIMKIAEACRTIDGDIGLMKLASGELNAIESDRIRQPKRRTNVKGKSDIDPADFTNGIKCNPAGRALGYAVHTRKGTGFELDRIVPASNIFFHGYFSRFDQVRGITPLTTALNAMQDLHESFDYNLLKAKMHALFGLAIVSDAETTGFEEVDQDDGETGDEDTEKYDVKLDGRPMKLELDPGDDVKIIESHSPSNEFQTYSELMIRLSLLALDIPYVFFNSKGSSYSAARSDLLLYLQSAKAKREDNRELLNNITTWKIGQWIGAGLLKLPAKMKFRDIKWEWVPSGIPWIDPLKEAKANGEAINLKIKSRKRICTEMGYDWDEEYRQIQKEEALVGVTPTSTITDEDLKDEK